MNIKNSILLLLLFSMLISFAQKKELSRKEHLGAMNKHYFEINDNLWNYVAHIANTESVTKLDKKRRAFIKLCYEENKEIVKLGAYKKNTVILDALVNYIEEM